MDEVRIIQESKVIVSIIVPIYNSKNHIGQCIKSILEQTYQNFELILIDDGSVDESYDICVGYAKKDSRIKLYRQDNRGVGSARNNGINKATGRYLMFVDSDDYLDKEMLEDGINHMDGDVDLYISGTLMEYYNDSDIYRTVRYAGIEKKYTRKELLENFDREYPLLCIGGPWSKLFRLDIINGNNCRFNTEMTVSEDGLFCLEYIRLIDLVSFSDKCFYHYSRGNNNSLWSRYTPNLYEYQSCVYGYMGEIMEESQCSQDAILRFRDLYFDIMIGCIQNEYKNKSRTVRREVEIIKKISKNVYIQDYIKSAEITKLRRRVFAFLIRNKWFYFMAVMFEIWNRWKKTAA